MNAAGVEQLAVRRRSRVSIASQPRVGDAAGRSITTGRCGRPPPRRVGVGAQQALGPRAQLVARQEAVTVALGLAQDVTTPAASRRGSSSGTPSARASASAVAKPIPSTPSARRGRRERSIASGAQRPDHPARTPPARRACPGTAAPPAGPRLAPGATAGPMRRAPMPGTSRRRACGSASTAASTSEPWRCSRNAAPRHADVLDAAQQRQQRRIGGRLGDAHVAHLELAAVARVVAPGARDLHRVARMHMRERPGEHHGSPSSLVATSTAKPPSSVANRRATSTVNRSVIRARRSTPGRRSSIARG